LPAKIAVANSGRTNAGLLEWRRLRMHFVIDELVGSAHMCVVLVLIFWAYGDVSMGFFVWDSESNGWEFGNLRAMMSMVPVEM